MSIYQISKLPTVRRSLFKPSDTPFETESSSFKEILHKTTAGQSMCGSSDIQAASKLQLIDQMNHIKVQMDTRLISALSTEPIADLDFLSPTQQKDLLPRRQISLGESTSNNWRNEMNHDGLEDPSKLDLIIAKVANLHGIDEALIKSIVKTESNFNPNSTSPKGAMGLMQLMPETARDLNVKDPYDPEQNIEGGTRYLKKLLNHYKGNLSLALAAYNWGAGNLERKPDQMPKETRLYVENVTRYYQQMKA